MRSSAFFPGSVGVIYRQFSVTLVAAMALSVVVALTLTPALCATILKPGQGEKKTGFFGLFNRGYHASSGVYEKIVGAMVRRRWRAMLAFVVIAAGLVVLFPRMQKGFLPQEDQGLLYAQVLMPPGSTMEQTAAINEQVSKYLLEEEGAAVKSVMTINGFSFGGRGQNSGLAFITLKDWDERKDPKLSANAIAGRASAAFSKLKAGQVFSYAPPAIPELGNAAGFQMQIVDRGGLGHEALIAARNQVVQASSKDPVLTKVRQAGLDDRPEYKVNVDQEKAAALGITLSEINTTLSATWGGSYVNDFIDQGRTKRVFVQGDAPFRMQPDDLGRWYVRNRDGGMVPFSAIASGEWAYGSPKLDRFSGFPTIGIQGEPAPGASTGDAMEAMERISGELPQGIGFAWSGLSYEERTSGSNAPFLYALSLLFVFLCLAALYESWSVPVSVMLVVPLGVLGAVAATLLAKLSNDVYFQVGLLATIGLAAKNAILIVEFAKELHEQGKAPVEAALEAAKLRLRPIVMTSLAFVLGVVPLAIAKGAGAAGQNAIGIAIIGGVLAATFLGVLFVPVFFVVITGKKKAAEQPKQQQETHSPSGAVPTAAE